MTGSDAFVAPRKYPLAYSESGAASALIVSSIEGEAVATSLYTCSSSTRLSFSPSASQIASCDFQSAVDVTSQQGGKIHRMDSPNIPPQIDQKRVLVRGARQGQ